MIVPLQNMKFDSLKTAIVVAVDSANGDRNAAAEALLSILAEDAELYDQVMQPLIDKAAHELVTAELMLRRRQCWAAPPSKPDSPAAVMSAARRRTELLLDMSLPHVLVPLRDATADDLGQSIDACQKQAAEAVEKVPFMDAVRRKLKGGKTCGQVFSEAQLRSLQARAG